MDIVQKKTEIDIGSEDLIIGSGKGVILVLLMIEWVYSAVFFKGCEGERIMGNG